jgi:flagellar motility protein MotE (MotC chaperone)
MLELKEQKKGLDLREQQMNEAEAQLRAERDEVAKVKQNVAQLQADFDKSVVRVNAEETPNLKKLAKVYADMAPDAAAAVLSQMEDGEIVKIMLFMKEAETAAILEIMAKQGDAKAKRAAAISGRIHLSTSRKEI